MEAVCMTSLTLTLKEKLLYILNNPEQKTADPGLIREMLDNIGSPDPVLRDELIYETFARWIEGDQLSPGQLRELLDTCLDDSHVFYRIGAMEEDSVFTRTFSLLVVALVIDAHRRKQFLTAADLHKVKEKMIKYMATEKDVRGHVGEKGWAHATAHAADVLGELALCKELSDKQDMLDILNAIRGKVVINNYIYINREDERMARAAVKVLGRKILEDQAIAMWLERFGEIKKTDRHPEDDYLRNNVKMFLRSLYFQLLPDSAQAQTRASIEAVLQKLSKF